MALYQNRVTAPAAFAAATAPDVTIPFVPTEVAIINEDTDPTHYVEVSYDQVTVVLRLTPGILQGLKLIERGTKIWLRGVGSPSVQVIAQEQGGS